MNNLTDGMSELDEVLEARKLANWAARVEAHPAEFSEEERKYARVILYYHDKWRALIYAYNHVAKLCEE